MPSPSEISRPRRNKTPCLTPTSIDGPELPLPRCDNRPASSPDLKALSLSVDFRGWRFASKKFRHWAHKLSKTHEPTWKKAGIFEAIMASTKKIHKDTSLVLAVAEKWCPRTKSFLFPWGEATITLQDVMLLLGIALAPAVLAHLYAELTLLRDHIRAFDRSDFPLKTDLSALFKLVQVWTWERFRKLQPPKPNPMLLGEPRLALWHDLKQRARDARKILKNSKIDGFEWRPYTKVVKNWEYPRLISQREVFARCTKVSKLVGIGYVEHYLPNRVASQFGMVQDVPCLVNRKNLSPEAALKGEKSRNERGKSMKRPREDDESTMVRCQTQIPSDNDDEADDDKLTFSQRLKRRFSEAYSGGDAYETVPPHEIEQRNEDTGETGSKAGMSMVLSPSDENNFSDPPAGFDGALDIGLSPPETMQACDDADLDVHGTNADKETMLVDGSKEPDCLLHKDGGIVGADAYETVPQTEQMNEETDEGGKEAKRAMKRRNMASACLI
ncbi:unnamed protein product [Thlaspi arvense]|uniref:Aminotransferase-like plant mobile domain-containing protein n=1 Tax=Thlaspi arvense TaxID=13288 RepID=A0AAU9RCI0_THLAR|nr:unnamed protein product [Thlaspi arvense]